MPIPIRDAFPVLAAMVSASAASAQCPPTFAPNSPQPIGSPYTVVVADFNRDNTRDLAAANFSGSNATVRLHNAFLPGTYLASTAIPLSFNPRGAAAADFNHDGNPDLAVVYNGGGPANSRLAIMLGTGDGSFQAPLLFPIASQPLDLRVADLNHDGHLDAVNVCGCGSISVMLGLGNGSFQPYSTFAPGLTNVYKVVLADVNSDGALDLVMPGSNGVGSGQISVALATGPATATYGAVGSTPTGWFGTWGGNHGDFNGDGRDDLVVTHSISNRVQVFLNTPGGLVGQTAVFTGSQPQDVAVADFNMDGRLDVAVSNAGSASVTVHLGDGAGGLSNATTFAVTAAPNSITAADMNNDGRPDIVTGDQNGGNASILLSTVPVLSFTQHPASAGTCATGGAMFSVVVAGSPGAVTYRWQISEAPGSWIDLATTPVPLPGGGNAFISAANSASVLVSVRQRVSGNFGIRCVATAACANGITAEARLTIGCNSIANIVTIGGGPTCDEQLTADDVIAFLSGFFAQQPISDVAGLGGVVGPDGQWTADDVVVFLAAFFAGCPD